MQEVGGSCLSPTLLLLVFRIDGPMLFITRFFAGTYSNVTKASTCSACIASTFVSIAWGEGFGVLHILKAMR